MVKRSRSSLSSSPFPYDDYEGSYDDASVIYYDSSDPTPSQPFQGDAPFSPNPPSFHAEAAIAHSPSLTAVPRVPRSDASKKQKRSDGPLLWFADGSELCPEFKERWSPETLQQEWIRLRLADTRGKEVTGVDAFTAKQDLAFLTGARRSSLLSSSSFPSLRASADRYTPSLVLVVPAFYYLPVMDRNKIRFFGKTMGRNEVVSTIVNCAEGNPILFRSRKRISAQFSSMKKGCLKVPGESESSFDFFRLDASFLSSSIR